MHTAAGEHTNGTDALKLVKRKREKDVQFEALAEVTVTGCARARENFAFSTGRRN